MSTSQPPDGQRAPQPERYLADENFPASTVRYLRNRGDDVLFVHETMAGADDATILGAAIQSGRIILTFDRDFGDLVIRAGQTAPGVVLFRLKQQAPAVVLPFLEAFFEARPVLRGYFTVASPGQFRQRPL